MGKPTTRTVAQFISMAIENEASVPPALRTDEYADVTEVGAELWNREGDETSLGHPYSKFNVKTSDGRYWEVRITGKA